MAEGFVEKTLASKLDTDVKARKTDHEFHRLGQGGRTEREPVQAVEVESKNQKGEVVMVGELLEQCL